MANNDDCERLLGEGCNGCLGRHATRHPGRLFETAMREHEALRPSLAKLFHERHPARSIRQSPRPRPAGNSSLRAQQRVGPYVVAEPGA
jgi:hypothetical protein